ncbi:MAG: DnaD domain protein [Eubacteriales bacterium]|nr:DnaD domain protein [Eubacteriales bacterium]
MFTIYSDSGSDSTMVSNLFIDEYMKSANDAQIKVYLYLLRVMGAHRSTSVSDMADQFNHTEKDVVRSLRYWEKKGLLSLTFDKKEDLVSICLCRPESAIGADSTRERHVLPFAPPDERQQTAAAVSDPALRMAAGADPAGSSVPGTGTGILRAPVSSTVTAGPVFSPDASSVPPPVAFFSDASSSGTSLSGKGNGNGNGSRSAPDNSTRTASGEETKPTGEDKDAAGGNTAASSGEKSFNERDALESFRNSTERAQLLFVIEQYIGKPLSLNEIRVIYTISEKLRFSDELLDYLIQYCVDRGKKDFRYIRKVAENWASQGIMTPAQAETSASESSSGSRRAAGASKNSSADSFSAASAGEKISRPARSSNSFNQFQQNSYDFDALEEELLQS